MSHTPAELKYASSHEWARLEEDGTVTVGISDHAQNALGDVVFVELPELGATLAAARGGRELTISHQGGQGADHPVHPAIPETRYLKALFAELAPTG